MDLLQLISCNTKTIGSIGMVFFGILGAWGWWQQNKAIWKNKSGQSVSVSWFICATSMFTMNTIYGISIKSIPLTIVGILQTSVALPAVIGLWRFKGFNKMQKILCTCFLCVLILATILSFKDWFFLLFSFLGIFFSLTQPLEIWKNKNSGIVEIKMLITTLIGTTFWIIYGFATDDWVIRIVSPIFFIILSITIALWAIYKKPKIGRVP